MKTKFFLLALAATLSMQANADQLFRHTDNAVVTAPTRTSINAGEIPAGMARVSLEAHDVWGDGSGYQLLLDNSFALNYYIDNDPAKGALLRWRSSATLMYTNWLNYYVYQETPFDIGLISSIRNEDLVPGRDEEKNE